jgi:hypothetical protein
MANDSNAKVAFTATHCGAELESLIEALPDTEYSLIDMNDARYRVTRDGDVWLFEGYTRGWWNYDGNLRGYLLTEKVVPPKSLFKRRQRPTFAPYPESLTEPAARKAWTDLVAALHKPGASLTVFVVDSDVGLVWLSQLKYSIFVTPEGAVDWTREGTIEDEELTIEKYLSVYGSPLREAVSELYLADDVDAFLEQWTAAHGDDIPTDAEVLAWFDDNFAG